ncbi:substrate-binding domain-containing protein [Microbacterium oxydans]|nr:substrate-binding domain-containing protein [Microbacterium oxydans]
MSAANTYLASARDAMADYADEENVEITDFDAKFDAGVQANQIQDVISSGQYQGVILTALDGAGMVPAVQEALDAGLEVVVLNQIVGDRFDTADPQVDGVAASVVSPPEITGERLGQLTADACADIDPCRVVYMFGLRAQHSTMLCGRASTRRSTMRRTWRSWRSPRAGSLAPTSRSKRLRT